MLCCIMSQLLDVPSTLTGPKSRQTSLAKECIHAPFKLHDYLKTKITEALKEEKALEAAVFM